MAEIIKFPEQRFCDDCGKPLDDGEGTVCAYKGCEHIGCNYCTSESVMCLEHIGSEDLRC